MTHELERLLRRSTARDEVAPGLFVGRRPRVTELPAGVALVIDLCAELGPSRGVRERCRYLALPTLDARAPEPATLERAVVAVLAADGPVLVHCAAGHGRSATVAAAVLLRRGMAATPAEAETFMRRARPRIRLSEVQRRALVKVR